MGSTVIRLLFLAAVAITVGDAWIGDIFSNVNGAPPAVVYNPFNPDNPPQSINQPPNVVPGGPLFPQNVYPAYVQNPPNIVYGK
uniref:Secreted protein n=1 Tax=Steinernema glaseri TaxID=37863 RepID=A0A1I7Y7C6_9BILA